MGCFDSVMVPCPKCGTECEFQSKGGECILKTYTMAEAPPDVMEDVNRHAPYMCGQCNTYFEVTRMNGKPTPVEVPAPEREWQLEYEEAMESRRLMEQRENAAIQKAMDWEAAYWALVKVIRK